MTYKNEIWIESWICAICAKFYILQVVIFYSLEAAVETEELTFIPEASSETGRELLSGALAFRTRLGRAFSTGEILFASDNL